MCKDVCCLCVSDAVMSKVLSTPSFQSLSFVSSLLVMLGLLKVRITVFFLGFKTFMVDLSRRKITKNCWFCDVLSNPDPVLTGSCVLISSAVSLYRFCVVLLRNIL